MMHSMRRFFHRILNDIQQNRIALIIILIYLAVTQFLFHTVCPFAILFGLPCPACGLTRAGLLLATGRFTAAFLTNAAIYLWVPLLIYLMVFRYFLGKRPPFGLQLATLAGLATMGYYVWRLAQGNPVSVPFKGFLK